MTSTLQATTEAYDTPDWGSSGPTRAGEYNNWPEETQFFRHENGISKALGKSYSLVGILKCYIHISELVPSNRYTWSIRVVACIFLRGIDPFLARLWHLRRLCQGSIEDFYYLFLVKGLNLILLSLYNNFLVLII